MKTAKFDELDDGLIRRPIDQTMIHVDGKLSVEFKNEKRIEI